MKWLVLVLLLLGCETPGLHHHVETNNTYHLLDHDLIEPGPTWYYIKNCRADGSSRDSLDFKCRTIIYLP